jgi:hypothetical protein
MAGRQQKQRRASVTNVTSVTSASQPAKPPPPSVTDFFTAQNALLLVFSIILLKK